MKPNSSPQMVMMIVSLTPESSSGKVSSITFHLNLNPMMIPGVPLASGGRGNRSGPCPNGDRGGKTATLISDRC